MAEGFAQRTHHGGALGLVAGEAGALDLVHLADLDAVIAEDGDRASHFTQFITALRAGNGVDAGRVLGDSGGVAHQGAQRAR